MGGAAASFSAQVGDEGLGVEVDAVGGLVLDPVPERLELGRVEDGAADADGLPVVGVLDLQAAGELLEEGLDLGRAAARAASGSVDGALLQRRAEGVLDAALRVEVALRDEVGVEGLGGLDAEAGAVSPRVGVGDGDGGELVALDDAEADAGVGLDLLLELLGELPVALAGDDGERVDGAVADAAAVLVDADAEAAADGLAPLALGADVAERADLEHVGVVPPLAEGGVGEDELERLVEAEEPLLVLHDELVGPLGVLAGARVGELARSC